MINQLTSRYRLILGGKKKKEREKRKHWKRTLEKRKFEICKSMEQLKEAEKMEKEKNRRGREMKGGVKKFGKPARTLASEVELP